MPDPRTLLYRAEELRTLAEDMKSDAKAILLRCAEDYEKWAKRLEAP